MNLSFSLSNQVKNELLNADVDFAVDSFKCLLMRADFSFSASNHLKLINIQTNTGTINFRLDATTAGTTAVIYRDSGSFITDGFVVGNYITLSAGNNTSKTLKITGITSATEMRVSLITGASLVDDGDDTPTYISGIITSNDEFATGGGYVAGGFAPTFTISGSLLYLDTFDEVDEFGAANLLTSPGCLIYDDTEANDLIIAFCRFTRWRVNV
jgi:hypothetical protein